jgi:hypothetical protein
LPNCENHGRSQGRGDNTARGMAKTRGRSLEEIEAAVRAELVRRDQEIARVRAEAAAAIRELEEQRRRADAAQRESQRKVKQRMAFVLGEFLLRNGLEDPTVRAIVESDAFDMFTRAVRHRGARAHFGLAAVGAEGATSSGAGTSGRRRSAVA